MLLSTYKVTRSQIACVFMEIFDLGWFPDYFFFIEGNIRLGVETQSTKSVPILTRSSLTLFQSNFATLDESTGIVTSRRADRHFEEEGPVLCEALDGIKLPSFPGYQVRVR